MATYMMSNIMLSWITALITQSAYLLSFVDVRFR